MTTGDPHGRDQQQPDDGAADDHQHRRDQVAVLSVIRMLEELNPQQEHDPKVPRRGRFCTPALESAT
jgi:hypothetical protein